MKKRKTITIVIRTFKIMLFLTFMYTVAIMFILRNHIIAIMILFAVSIYLTLSQIDNINKRLDKLEEKNGR